MYIYQCIHIHIRITFYTHLCFTHDAHSHSHTRTQTRTHTCFPGGKGGGRLTQIHSVSPSVSTCISLSLLQTHPHHTQPHLIARRQNTSGASFHKHILSFTLSFTQAHMHIHTHTHLIYRRPNTSGAPFNHRESRARQSRDPPQHYHTRHQPPTPYQPPTHCPVMET